MHYHNFSSAIAEFVPSDDVFFYVLHFSPDTGRVGKTLGEIRVGSQYQAQLPENDHPESVNGNDADDHNHSPQENGSKHENETVNNDNSNLPGSSMIWKPEVANEEDVAEYLNHVKYANHIFFIILTIHKLFFRNLWLPMKKELQDENNNAKDFTTASVSDEPKVDQVPEKSSSTTTNDPNNVRPPCDSPFVSNDICVAKAHDMVCSEIYIYELKFDTFYFILFSFSNVITTLNKLFPNCPLHPCQNQSYQLLMRKNRFVNYSILIILIYFDLFYHCLLQTTTEKTDQRHKSTWKELFQNQT